VVTAFHVQLIPQHFQGFRKRMDVSAVTTVAADRVRATGGEKAVRDRRIV